MNRSTGGLFQRLKHHSPSSTIDENSKKIEKRKSLPSSHSTKMAPSAELRTLDMKPVKVLVERTKFNEMHVVDSSRTTKKTTLKLVNGGSGLEKKPEKRGRTRTQKPLVKSTPQKRTIDELFKIRKCYVKIPKDKVLIRLQSVLSSATQWPLEKKRSRGRPKKRTNRRSTPLEAATPTVVNATIPATDVDGALKRKLTEGADSSPPKRSRKPKGPKGTEFFINIGALTRTPSPRRRVTTNFNSPEEGKRTNKKPVKRGNSRLSLSALRQKFGSQFFKSYVKIKRIRDASRVVIPQRLLESAKKNKKKLTVSFLETVEVFGGSPETDEFLDYDDSLLTPKAARFKHSSSASPLEASTPRKSGGILKRKERISYSPLKEHETSPRKEQLKRANEKIVRLSVSPQQKQPTEERKPETAPTKQPEPEKDTSTVVATFLGDSSNGDDRNILTEPTRSSTPFEPETELITPPPSAEKDESIEQESTTNQKPQESLENKKSLEENTTSLSTVSDKDKEDEESFQSAAASPLPNLEENENAFNSAKKNEDNFSQHLAVSDNEEETTVKDVKEEFYKNDTEELLESNKEEACNDANDVNEKSVHDREGLISDENQVNSSNTSDQHFEDAHEFVASLLHDSAEADRNEAEAVLNDVCQMAAAENAALLTEEEGNLVAGEEFNSQPNNVVVAPDDEDNDFTSVLTHPEVEKSLQSTASTLVPNSQEIVVAAAAVSSQAAVGSATDADVTEDTFSSVVAEVECFTKDIYSEDVGITGADVMMDNVQANNSLDDIFDDDVDDDIISSLRMSSGNIDIGNDKSLPIQVIETEVMAIPNEPDLIFDKPLGTTASILGTPMGSTNDTLTGNGHSSTPDSNSKISLGRIFQSVKSYVMSPGGDKNAALQD